MIAYMTHSFFLLGSVLIYIYICMSTHTSLSAFFFVHTS
jgi:hypothetical protein